MFQVEEKKYGGERITYKITGWRTEPKKLIRWLRYEMDRYTDLLVEIDGIIYSLWEREHRLQIAAGIELGLSLAEDPVKPIARPVRAEAEVSWCNVFGPYNDTWVARVRTGDSFKDFIVLPGPKLRLKDQMKVTIAYLDDGGVTQHPVARIVGWPESAEVKPRFETALGLGKGDVFEILERPGEKLVVLSKRQVETNTVDVSVWSQKLNMQTFVTLPLALQVRVFDDEREAAARS